MGEGSAQYKEGDIVWVKLGPCWWPGEVVNKVPDEDYTPSKKPPLAIVKFFNENAYEFVKTPNLIFPYNCVRKNDFIKKGMDSFRASNAHMEKFPTDVNLAELKTNGNPNILSEPQFLPQKKTNIVAEVFGTASPKKLPKDGFGKNRGRPSTSKNSSKKPTKINVTHRRFLGVDDYESRIRVQYPGKDSSMCPSSDEEVSKLNAEPSKDIVCSVCKFTTRRIDVMLFHVNCHIKGIPCTPTTKPPPKKKNTSPRKPKVSQKRRISDTDDKRLSDSDSDEDVDHKPKQKRKRRSQGSTSKKIKLKKEEEPKTITDIRSDLLAEWSDSDDIHDEEVEPAEPETVIPPPKSPPKSQPKSPLTAPDDSSFLFDKLTSSEATKQDELKVEEKAAEVMATTKKEDKSCFDFEEEEEDTSIVHTAIIGRKIPRVIPPSEKRKSSDPDNEDASLPLAEDDINRIGLLKENSNVSSEQSSSPLETSTSSAEPPTVQEKDDFKDLMDATIMPEVPEIPAQNFPSGKAIKFPDKPEAKEVATKLTNPKKRFVKSFEDFEMLQNEQRKAEERKKEAENKEAMVEKEEKAVETEGKNAEKEETKIEKEENKVDKEETKVEKEETKVEKVETKVEKAEVEKASEVEEAKSVESDVKISKLKCQIMSKLGDEMDEPVKPQPVRSSPRTSHRTPRSKILENYRNSSSSSSKVRKSTEEKVETPEVNHMNKRKSKYLKFRAEQEKSEEEAKEMIESEIQEVEQPKVVRESKDANVTKTQMEERPVEDLSVKEAIPPFDDEMKEAIVDKETTQSKEALKPETIKVVESPKKEMPSKSSIFSESIREPVVADEYLNDFFTFLDKPANEETKTKSKYFAHEEKEKEEVKKEEKEKKDSKKEDNKDSKKEEKKEVKKDDKKEVKKEEKVEIRKEEKKEVKKEEKKDYNREERKENKREEILKEDKKEKEVRKWDKKEGKKMYKKDDKEEDEKKEEKSTAIGKVQEELSALTTLAAISELKTNLEEKLPVVEKFKLPPISPSAEMITIDGNLTVVSEKDLADGQVEITASASPTNKKPVTLTNFSLDFQESEPAPQEVKVTSRKPKEMRPVTVAEPCDVEDHIPSQIVCAGDPPKEVKDETISIKLPQSSKLLERLTEPRQNSNQKTQKTLLKSPLLTKNSRSMIKSAVISKPTAAFSKSTAIISKPAPVISKSAPVIPKPPSIVTTPSTSSNKPIILSEKIIKPEPAVETSGSVSVQKITSNRIMLDADEIDTFIIQKDPNKHEDEEEEIVDDFLLKSVASKKKKQQQQQPQIIVKKPRQTGKAKILQQTIITPSGEIIQPQTVAQQPPQQPPEDNSVFDINSMPIVLSDQILTPESIENMPIFLSDPAATAAPAAPETVTPTVTKTQPLIKKQVIQQTTPMRVLNKTMIPTTIIASGGIIDKTPKLTMKTTKTVVPGPKMIKQNSFTPGSSSSKQGKYVIVSQGSMTPQANKFTPAKKQTIIKRAAGEMTGTLTKIAPEPSGNKIMILTNQQGQQQRVLLTPAQQKMMGYQNQSTKVAKTIVKGNMLQRGKDVQIRSSQGTPSCSGLLPKNMTAQSPATQRLITSSGQVLSQLHTTPGKTVRIEKTLGGRKLQMQSQKMSIKPPTQKTILIKNQHGQTVHKIQGTDDALLDKQVAEQLEAIKARGILEQQQKKAQLQHQQQPEILNYRSTMVQSATTPRPVRRSYSKKTDATTKVVGRQGKEGVSQQVPPLAPISPKRQEASTAVTPAEEKPAAVEEPKRAQLVIQDAMGNQTTITEGQILALPSETVDGQPQSYMLVTLDETGNLTPLNNEALMSLDPNLGLTGDLGNMVLQMDQGKTEATVAAPVQPIVSTNTAVVAATVPQTVAPQMVTPESSAAQPVVTQQEPVSVTAPAEIPPVTTVAEKRPELPTVNCSVSGEPGGQQLIVTGDPIAAQKFLESLTENSSDLANILAASAEGGSILIQTDGQQILINTDTDNQMLLSVNTDNLSESTENGGNPIFATQPSKNQDILAAALADTDVFQPNDTTSQKSQLSPNSALYPMNVGNVLETSLTLNSPIMTPLEVPSTNNKKIDESDILTQVPKNVDLPITITDPNISQTVSQQQMIAANELPELSLPISSEPSAESPSFVYSLPSLDETVDINQKPFNSSMPLLTEDEETVKDPIVDDKIEMEIPPCPPITISEQEPIKETPNVTEEQKVEEAETESKLSTAFLDDTEGLCTLGGEMCSSLSEPPPDMFDLSAVLSSQEKNRKSEKSELKIDVSEETDKEQAASTDLSNPDTTSVTSVTETSSPNGSISLNEDSCEIPVQPALVTTLPEETTTSENGSKRSHPEEDGDGEGEPSKKCKLDD